MKHQLSMYACAMQTELMILGDLMAPWEDPATAPAISKSLGNLKEPIFKLLERDPAEQLTVMDFHRACRRMMSNTTISSSTIT